MTDFFKNMRIGRTVFKRTKTRADLPKLVVYTAWLSDRMQRRVRDIEGKDHDLDDTVLQSYYKLVTGGQAKSLIDKHWPDVKKSAEKAAAAPAE